MKRKLRIILSVLLMVFPFDASFALDYVIKEVIEVGEAGFAPFVNPIIWSPDGTKIAFTKAGVIYFSDTLGNVQEVIKPEMPIHRWDWVSDNQIAVKMRAFTGKGINSDNRISTIDVKLKRRYSFIITQHFTVIEKCRATRPTWGHLSQ
jgi:hypothetical protein